MNDERFFARLAEKTDAAEGVNERAPARLKSRLYSALVAEQAAGGTLLSLSTIRAEGNSLCVFENVLQLMPVGEHLTSLNPCRVCHARLLAEHFESPPIYWPHCPYVEFRRR